jgi:predicted GNAT family acetyltransferase
MSSDEAIAIEHEEADGRGAFFIARSGVRLAEMTYTRAGEDLVIVDHTEVHEALRGLGAGRKLLDALVAWARRTHTRVMATCPYAKAQFDKDPSIRDVLA